MLRRLLAAVTLPALVLGCSAVALASSATVTFTGLPREPHGWYKDPACGLADVSVLANGLVGSVFPTGVRKLELRFTTAEDARKQKLQASFLEPDNKARRRAFSLRRGAEGAWSVPPKGRKSFAPGLYTFQLARGKQLLASLDVIVVSSPVVDEAGAGHPGYTTVPPPERIAAVPRSAEVTMEVRGGRGGRMSALTYAASAGGRREVVDDVVRSARHRSVKQAKISVREGSSGGLLGAASGGSSTLSTAAKAVAALLDYGSGQPSDFSVKRPQLVRKWANSMVESHALDDALQALGGRRPVPSAAAAAADTKGFRRGVLLLPLAPRPDEASLLALLIVDDVSVALDDAPVISSRGYDFRYGGDTLHALPLVVDPASSSVRLLGRHGQNLVAGPARVAVPESRSDQPFAAIHQVVPQDDTGDHAVAICSLSPSLDGAGASAAVFPLRLSRERH